MSERSVVWRRLDKPGHEFARLFFDNSCWHLNGTAVFLHERQPCCLGYRLRCNSKWETLSGQVAGWVGEKAIGIEISVEQDRRWRLSAQECAQAAGCIDLDLNFSPLTNLLPIRRLNLNVGEKAEVRAAWLKFPSFEIEPLEQSYYRIDATTYRYESAGGSSPTLKSTKRVLSPIIRTFGKSKTMPNSAVMPRLNFDVCKFFCFLKSRVGGDCNGNYCR